MPPRLTPNERSFIVIEYARTSNGREVARRFMSEFGRPIDHATPRPSSSDSAPQAQPKIRHMLDALRRKTRVKTSWWCATPCWRIRPCRSVVDHRNWVYNARHCDAFSTLSARGVGTTRRHSTCATVRNCRSAFRFRCLQMIVTTAWFTRGGFSIVLQTTQPFTPKCCGRMNASCGCRVRGTPITWCGGGGETARQSAAAGNQDYRSIVPDGLGRCVCWRNCGSILHRWRRDG